MDKEFVIEKTRKYVKGKMSGEPTGHDWWHVERVYRNAMLIGKEEKADMFIIKLAALLHDIEDWKISKEKDLVEDWLKSLDVDEGVISHVCEIIEDLSFKGAGVESHMRTKEGMAVQDADRLDALGAIGIARCFAYGGYKGREIYNPEINPQTHNSFEQYKSGKGPAINHFYEKLLLLKDLMNTETGKKMAEERHKFMEKFLEQFLTEWKN